MGEFNKLKKSGYLEGQLLIATPGLRYSCFSKAVIYVCSHTDSGAMGIIINQTLEDLNSTILWNHFNIDVSGQQIYLPVHFGGPIDSARGFILHSADYQKPDTVNINHGIALSSSVEILKDIAKGDGPKQRIFALGYAGWGPQQLEQELEANSWLTIPANSELIFGVDNGAKWQQAAKSINVDLYKLSPTAGHA
jgi:putative transcriptional regulator